MVVKYERDHARALTALPTLIDPNATVPDKLHDHHNHSHGGHSHSHANGGDPHAHADDIGPSRRAEKDKPGRHGPGHYGTLPHAEGLETAPVPAVAVSSDRGKRSFAGGLGRRRPF